MSSAGLSWIDIDTINRKVLRLRAALVGSAAINCNHLGRSPPLNAHGRQVLKSAPAVRFPTEPRHLGLSREQLQVATDHPAPNEYQSFKSSYGPTLHSPHAAPGPRTHLAQLGAARARPGACAPL